MLIRILIFDLILCQLHALQYHRPPPFSLLVRSPTFIDKTSFLPELFNLAKGNIIITTPPGFGKTTVLAMIEQFAGVELNEDFSMKKFRETASYQIFRNTTIARDKEFLQNHLSQYIVINLNLQIELPANFTSDTLRDKISESVYAQIEKYSGYLINAIKNCEKPEEDPEMKLLRRRNDAREEREFTRNFLYRNATAYDGKLTLRRIIKLLSTHFNRRVILLMDNYDHFARGFLFKEVDLKVQKYYEDLNAIIYNAYDLHYCSNYLFKIFVTSTSAAPLEWVDRLQHKFYVYNFTLCRFLSSHPFLELMGYTETEMNWLMNKSKLSAAEREALITYYNPHQSYPQSKKIYCPKSVMLFIEIYRKSVRTTNDVLQTVYEEAIERIGFLKEHLNNASRLELELLSIIANQSIRVKIDNLLRTGNLLNKSLKRINEIMNDSELVISKQTWSYLFESGYLVHVVDDENGKATDTYKVSNEEARQVLYKLFVDHHDEATLPLNELGYCSKQFVQRDVVYSKESLASLFALMEHLLGKCINNTARHLLDKDNEIKYQALLYAASRQFAMNGNDFVVSTMQFRGEFGDSYYGVYYYDKSEKICSIVISKNSDDENNAEKEVFLNEVAASYSLPHGDVKHILYVVINVFADGHLKTFSTIYKRDEEPVSTE